MREAINVLEMIPSRVDPDIFYDVYRPLLAGFYPDGLCFELSPPEIGEGGEEGGEGRKGWEQGGGWGDRE